MPISARLMFVPGGLPARRLGLGRLSAGSQRISYGSPSRRLPLSLSWYSLVAQTWTELFGFVLKQFE